MRYTFVILHYNTIKDTINCINSILENIKETTYIKYNIVVVDNASTNNTGIELKQKYKNYKKITIILNKKNLGFSGGNNIGYQYAIKMYNPDFVIMINNDTIIKQKNFLHLIGEKYKKNHFAVLGPKIYNADGNVTKVRMKMPTLKEMNDTKKYNKKMIILTKLGLSNIYIRIKKKKNKIYSKKKNHTYDSEIINPLLHGCCWIFSREYLNKFDGIVEKTFMYGEEELLYLRVIRNKLKLIYYPKLEIYHMELGSTKMQERTLRKSMIRRYINIIKSLDVLIEEIKKDS